METNEHENPPNRLIDATSPYLLQHAHNPVHWQPWDKAALEQARREDKPIFLSIGYSACHWCHVMEREVFENREIAAIMNEHFVNIKVDREERPDLDELYMLATQLMSGSGGWPMSVWLTPELKPFYAGTYFPPVDGYGRPGFPKVELALAEAWKARRGEVVAQAGKVVEAIRQHADETGGGGEEGGAGRVDLPAALGLAVEQFADKFDAEHGGLGASPKFPPHQALHLWLSILRHPDAAGLSGKSVGMVREMTTKTLDGMMRGGIYDHVGGGFARYSTDEKWLVPHFEKMLYDNAQLAAAYACAAVVFHRQDYARVARETLDFWLREMTGHEGTSLRAGTTAGFYSTLDADSEGHEGKYYVWTAEQIREALPEGDDAAVVMAHFGVTEEGNWDESPVPRGTVLSLAKSRARSVSKGRQETADAQDGPPERIEKLVRKLREVRATRIPPHLDDKILTSWNGLMISALAIAGRVLHEPRYLEAAHRGMGFLLTHHVRGKELLRVSRHGAAHTAGFLEDHAFLLNGLMDLVDATAATSLPGTMARKRALELADTLIEKFADDEHGGFFFTAKSGDQLFARMKNAGDNATPSANGMAIRALLRLARVSGKEKNREVAMKAVGAFAGNIQRRADYFPTILQSLLEDADAAAHHVAAGASGPVVEEGTLLALEPARSRAALLELSGDAEVMMKGNVFEAEMALTIAAGFHVQSNRPRDKERFATVARLRGELPLVSQEWEYPAEAGEGYSGRIILRVRGELPEGTAAGLYTFRATVLAQPCDEKSCLAPEKVSFDFQVRKQAEPAA